MFYLPTSAPKLRRRAGRTALTALGLGVGVGPRRHRHRAVQGPRRAQQKVLKPLTGVGTDMSVTRPLRVSGSGSGQTFTPGGGGRVPASPSPSATLCAGRTAAVGA